MAVLSTREIAERFDFSISQVRRLIREGKIKAKKVGICYVIDERSIQNLKRRRCHDGFRKPKDGSE